MTFRRLGRCRGCVGLVTPPAQLGHGPPTAAGVETDGDRPDEVALAHDRDRVRQTKKGDLTSGNVSRGGVTKAWRGATLPVTGEQMFAW
jgi:hypothetical protein